MGKYIFSLGHSGLWENIRPPGLPFLLGLSSPLGLDSVVFGDLITLGFVLGIAVLLYLLCASLFNKRTAVIAIILTVLTPFFFLESLMIMTAIPALFFCLASLYSLTKRHYFLSGALACAAFIFRYPAGLILVALNLLILFEGLGFPELWKIWKQCHRVSMHVWLARLLPKGKLRRLFMCNLGFLPLFLGLIIFNKAVDGAFFKPIMLASLHQSNPTVNVYGFLANILYYPIVFLFAMPLVYFSLLAIFKRRNKALRYIFLPFIIFCVYFFLIPNKQERFAVLFLPYLAVFAAFSIDYILDSMSKPFLKKHRKTAYAAFALLLFALLFIPLWHDYGLFKTRFPSEKPEFVDDYIRYADMHMVKGQILTSDPVPAAYGTNKYIGFYNNITDAKDNYEVNKGYVSAVIYNPSAFPCFNENCIAARAELENCIRRDGLLVYNKTWWGDRKEIYLLQDNKGNISP
jgi:hypothetical protein